MCGVLRVSCKQHVSVQVTLSSYPSWSVQGRTLAAGSTLKPKTWALIKQTDQSVSSSQLCSCFTSPLLCPQVLKYVDPLTHCVRYYTPRGRFVHVPPASPCCDWASDINRPWWRDERYEVGRLSTKTRWIRVVNTLSSQEQRLEVSCHTHLTCCPWKLHLELRPPPKKVYKMFLGDED